MLIAYFIEWIQGVSCDKIIFGFALRHLSSMKRLRNFINRNEVTRSISLDLGFETCRDEYRAKILKMLNKGFIEEKILDHFSLDADLLPRYCAVCSMYYLKKYGITGVKIIGRVFFNPKKIKDVKFVRGYLDEI